MFYESMDELKLLKGWKMLVELEDGSEPDTDDDWVFYFRKRWMAEWSGKYGSLETTSEFSITFPAPIPKTC